MKTIFGLYQLAAKDYNENLRTLREDPETVTMVGADLIYSLQNDLRLMMSTIEEVNNTLGGTFIREHDEYGYIKKIVSQTPHTGCAVEFDFDIFEFVPVPYDMHAH